MGRRRTAGVKSAASKERAGKRRLLEAEKRREESDAEEVLVALMGGRINVGDYVDRQFVYTRTKNRLIRRLAR